MKRENDHIVWEDNRIIEYAIDRGESHLIVTIFKERPEALKHLYMLDYEHAQASEEGGKLYRYLQANPQIAFQLLQHAFPDVVNRLWFAAWRHRRLNQPADAHQLALAYRSILEPYTQMHRDWIRSDRLADMAENEEEARRRASLFNALDHHLLPHAQFCFLSSALITDVMKRLIVYTDVSLFQYEYAFVNLSSGGILADPTKWINPLQVSITERQLRKRRNSPVTRQIDSLGPLAEGSVVGFDVKAPYHHWRDDDINLRDEEAAITILVPPSNASIAEARGMAQRASALYVRPDWKHPTIEHLHEVVDVLTREAVRNGEDTQGLTALRQSLVEARQLTSEGDPLLHEYLAETREWSAKTLYQLYFEDKALWWNVLLSKIALVEKLGIADHAIFPVQENGRPSSNGHRIFQCRCCGEETHNVDTETGSFFCNQKCMNAYAK